MNIRDILINESKDYLVCIDESNFGYYFDKYDSNFNFLGRIFLEKKVKILDFKKIDINEKAKLLLMNKLGIIN